MRIATLCLLLALAVRAQDEEGSTDTLDEYREEIDNQLAEEEAEMW